MKKSIPKVRERESEASILGNVREREFPLTPGCVLHSVAEEEPVPVPQVFKLHLDDASEKGTHLMENCMR